MCTTLFKKKHWADSGEMCSAVVFLGRVLALVLAQEMQDNRPQYLTHVRLADQVSHYNHQICRLRVLTSPKGHSERQGMKTHV